MNISLNRGGSAVIVTIRGKTEKHSPVELPGIDSLAVEEAMSAFQREVDLPSIVSLLQNAGQFLFLSHSILQGSAYERDAHDLLETLSRSQRENTHIIGAIGSAAERLAGQVRASFAFLTGCEEVRAFHALRECPQAAADMLMFSRRAWDSFQTMAEVSSQLLEDLTGVKWPWGLDGNIGLRPLSELPEEFTALGKFLAEQDGIWRLRNLAKKRLAEAADGYLSAFRMNEEMKKAEQRGNGLAVIPLMFRAFSFTAAPAAAVLQDKGHDAGSVRQALEHLESFSKCRDLVLRKSVEHTSLTAQAVLAGKFKEAAIHLIAAAIPLFQEIANVLLDFQEFCEPLDCGLYLSGLPHFRLEALLKQARDAAEEKRRKFYGSPPVARNAFLSMTRIQAIARLCAVYCAEHERELPREDSPPAFPAAGGEERDPSKLAAALAAPLKAQTAADVAGQDAVSGAAGGHP